MAENKPLTKKDLESVLRDVLKNLPTRKEMFGIVSQSSEAVICGVEKMIDGLRDEMNRGFDELKTGQKDLQRQITDLKTDTPTMKEFNKLKEKMHFHHPAN